MNARGKIKIFTGLICAVCIVCILCACFFVWQLSEGIKAEDNWGITSNVIMIAVLLFVAIIGIAGSLRKSQNCLNSFLLCASIVLLMCIAEMVITSIGTAKCDEMGSSGGDMWDFICSSSSWVLLIPMCIIIVVLIAGIVFDALLKKAISADENGDGEGDGGNLSYYPS